MVLLSAALFAAVAGVLGGPVVGLMSGEIGDPSAESVRTLDTIAAASGQSADGDVLLLVDVPAGTSTAAGRDRIAAVAADLASVPGLARVTDATTPPTPALNSVDQHASLIIGFFRADVADPEEVARDVMKKFEGRDGIALGGSQVISATISETVGADLARAELFAFPLLLVLSIIIFRGVVAAVVPVALGSLTVVSALLGLRGIIEFTNLSQFVMNLLIGLGAGLSIDYSLLVISRYREEVDAIGHGRAAVRLAMARAGRTILFSAITVAAAMSTLMLFPQIFFRSMGIGGVVVTTAAAVVALTVLPAVLVVLGPWINRWPAAWHGRRGSSDARSGSFWYRLAIWEMKRPVLVLVAVLSVITIASLPTLGAAFQNVDASSLPTNAEPRNLEQRLRTEFALAKGTVVTAVHATEADAPTVNDLAGRMAGVRGYLPEGPPAYVGDDVWVIRGGTGTEPYTAASLATVRELRALPTELTVSVGGQTASFADLRASIVERLPYALAVVAVVVLLVIFLLTGSVLIPIKTLVINGLTVTATLGVLIWIFQHGHLEGLLRYTASGRIDLLQPILVLIIAFGLSTDYGVFLLARIKEHYDQTGDSVEAVAVGLGRTGRVISNAALLMCVAIGAFSTSGLVFIKVLGVGAVTAVALDATVVRAFLVPTAMKLLGPAAWWAPGWLRRLHRRIAIEE